MFGYVVFSVNFKLIISVFRDVFFIVFFGVKFESVKWFSCDVFFVRILMVMIVV